MQYVSLPALFSRLPGFNIPISETKGASGFLTYVAKTSGGDLFTDNKERGAMLDILIKTDLDLAWPTASAQAYLRTKWGWDT